MIEKRLKASRTKHSERGKSHRRKMTEVMVNGMQYTVMMMLKTDRLSKKMDRPERDRRPKVKTTMAMRLAEKEKTSTMPYMINITHS